MSTFIARYTGPCGACDERVEPGNEVIYVEDILEHVACPDVVPEEPVQVCPGCFMALPLTGICDDCG